MDAVDFIFYENLIAALGEMAKEEQRPSEDFNESEERWVAAFRETK